MSSSEFADYTWILYKKFLFMVHPDFFTEHTREKGINTKSISALSRIVNAVVEDPTFDIKNSKFAGTRTLIFYVKGSDVMPKPRKVKLSTMDFHTSIRDILSDYDIALPTVPKHERLQMSSASPTYSQYMYSAGVSMESLEPFLGALLDRRELMSWRYERQQALKKIVDSCRDLLGVDEVEIRYSWSAQNHAKMFSMLLDILHEKQGDLRLPLGTWKHLKLVLTNDDCSNHPISAFEGEVQLCPGHVPLQWLETLTAVDSDTITDAEKYGDAISRDLQTALPLLNAKFRRGLLRGLEAQDFGRKEMNVCICNAVRVNFRRGYTSSRVGFRSLLASILADVPPQVHNGIAQTHCGRDNWHTFDTKEYKVTNAEEQQKWKLDSDALLDASTLWLSEVPLTVDIVVESGHGSKILSNGDIRIDNRAGVATLWKLLEEATAFDALKNTAITKMKRRALNEQVQAVSGKLGLVSLTRAVGVTEDHFFHFLQRLASHIDGPNVSRALLNLRGLRVKVGHYASIDADGSVIVPHRLLLESEKWSMWS